MNVTLTIAAVTLLLLVVANVLGRPVLIFTTARDDGRAEDEALAVANSGHHDPGRDEPASSPRLAEASRPGAPPTLPGGAAGGAAATAPPAHDHGGLAYVGRRYRCGCTHYFSPATGALFQVTACNPDSSVDWDADFRRFAP